MIQGVLRNWRRKLYMSHRVIDITRYDVRSSDLFFFDNSVWMYIFCPLGKFNYEKQKIYSSFLKRVDTSRGGIFINSLILSEYANRCLRIDFELWKRNDRQPFAEYKRDFVGTERYQQTVGVIIPTIESILSFCERGNDNFNSINIDKILSNLFLIDFNDSYYIEFSKQGKFKIVTDDQDFVKIKNQDMDVLTIFHKL